MALANFGIPRQHMRLNHVSTLMAGCLGDLWEWTFFKHQQLRHPPAATCAPEIFNARRGCEITTLHSLSVSELPYYPCLHRRELRKSQLLTCIEGVRKFGASNMKNHEAMFVYFRLSWECFFFLGFWRPMRLPKHIQRKHDAEFSCVQVQ